MYNENKPAITDNELANAKRACIEHRAIWMAYLLDEIRKSGGDMEKIGREAIHRCGCFQVHANYKDRMKDPMSMLEFADIFLEDTCTFENRLVNSSEDEFHVEMHYCPLLSAWRKLGFSEEDCKLFCDIAMEGDRQFAREMGAEFTLSKKIAEGDDCCDLCLSRKK